MPRYGMAIDLDACIGCRACMEACKTENSTPQGSFWMNVFRFEDGEYPDVRTSFLPRPCMHCENAPCVKVCPVGARFQRDDGLVLTDFDRCIGCRYCEVACPYGVNYFNWKAPEENQYFDEKASSNGNAPPYRNPDGDRLQGEEGRTTAIGGHFKGVMEKCTFCVQRVERGLTTACAATCPVGAIVFGDLDDPNSAPSRLLAERHSFQLLEEAGTRPRVHYVGSSPPGPETKLIEPIKGGPKQ